MRIGIVGSEQAKFTADTESIARGIIDSIIHTSRPTHIVSGGCHLGGVDIFAQEQTEAWNLFYNEGSDPIQFVAHLPTSLQWSTGYAPRNLAIAKDSDEVHCITVRELPSSYMGMRFPLCYHCAREGAGFADVPHIKSGGCWTMHKARKLGKKGVLHVI